MTKKRVSHGKEDTGLAQPVDAATYSAAIEAASLRDIRLIKSSFLSHPEAHARPQPNWRPTYGCGVEDAFYDEEAKLLTGWVKCEVAVRSGRRKIVAFDATYLLVYDIQGEPAEDAALAFVRHVGNFAVYPYFRAHFADTVSQGGLRMPPLPILKEDGARRIQAHLPADSVSGERA